MNGNRVGCSYKEFLACNPREFDGKRGAVVLTRWIKKMENVQDMSGCSVDQKVKYTVGSFVEKALTWWNSQIRMLSRQVDAMVGACHVAYTDRFHELERLVPHLVTPESRMIESNDSIKKVEKKGNVREPSKDKSGRDDSKRTRTGNVFATTMKPVGRENMEKDYRGVPRNVNPVNSRNPPVRACYECGSTDHDRGRAFMLGAEEPRQDSNIMTGIEPSELGFRYDIEIANGQLVEIDKVIKGCNLEIKGHVFDIDLIPFGHESFDVIIGLQFFSNIDLRSGYHQLRVHEDDISKTMFRTRYGHFKFTAQEEHVEHSRLVLKLIKKEKLYAKFSKCELWLREVQFLRHVINGNGIHVEPSKIKKSKTFDWGEEQELAFQTLKDKLCNAPVLALPDGSEDFVVYCDTSRIGLGCVLMQRGKRHWIELFSNYDCEICYHPGKVNVVADALSRKERVKPKRVRAMNMILQSSIKDRIERENAIRQLCGLRLEKRRKPLEFSVGDYVLLKVSPWKGVVHFGTKGKLEPRFFGPFEIVEKVGPVPYRLDFPGELNGVHDTFYESYLKKCLADPTLQVRLAEIQVDAKFNFVEEPMEILERESLRS
nr:hypothetical protein [Tanacetum cinerariifolium]